MVQFKVDLMITGAIKEIPRDRLYQELGLESLADRRWSRRLFFFHRVIQGLFLSYLQNYYNAVSEGAYLTSQQQRTKLSQFLQELKYLRFHFFHIALKNRVNSTTKLEI